MNNKIIDTTASDIVEEGLKLYGKETIEQRCIPDFRDGFKPVQRRILYDMFDRKMFPDRGLKKSSFVVGDTMARFHPHGDLSIFSSLVNMVQDRYPLIYGSGNWGDEYSPAAAPRYIDCRLNEIALELFEYIYVVDFIENYSGDLKEPLVLPSKLPLLLMNGSSGIAVGVSSTIPPHNLKELVKAFKLLIKNPESSMKDICKYIKGPDYKSGVLVSTPKKVREVYEKGIGSLIFRCQYSFVREGKQNVLNIFNLAPYFNKDAFLKECDDLVSKKLIDYVVDDSAGGEHKLSVGFKNENIISEKVIPMLYKSISYQFYITERFKDKVIFSKTDLKSLMLKWLDYQRILKRKFYNFKIEELMQELNKLKLKLLATKHINTVVKALKDVNPVEKLMDSFNITKKYALLILECRLGSLAKASIDKQNSLIKSLQEKVDKYKNLLDNIDDNIIKDLASLSKFFDKKRCVIREIPPSIKTDNNLWIVLDISKNIIKKIYNKDHIINNNKYKTCLESNGFYSIDKAGLCVYWRSYQDFNLYPNTFEIISGSCKYLICTDKEGYLVVIDLYKTKNKKEFLVLKTSTELVQAIGFNENDQLMIENKLYTLEDLKISRIGTKGIKVLNKVNESSIKCSYV